MRTNDPRYDVDPRNCPEHESAGLGVTASELKSFDSIGDTLEAAARHGYSVSFTMYLSPPEPSPPPNAAAANEEAPAGDGAMAADATAEQRSDVEFWSRMGKGAIVRSRITGESYTVVGRSRSGYHGVRLVEISNPPEWELIGEAVVPGG